MRIRLDRWLAALNEGSRSQVKEWIRDGRAAVDGRVIRDPALSFDPETAELSLGGRILDAARDKKQPTVMDLLPAAYAGIGCMPVGRLDKDTTGLLVFTTDGEMNHRLLSPGRHVDKTYRVRAAGRLTEKDAEAFAAGMDLGDFTALPAKLTILQAGEEASLAECVIREGKFHQVKRMFEAVGHEVLDLHRTRFGPLALPAELQEGQWRELTEEELASLRRAAGMAAAEDGGGEG